MILVHEMESKSSGEEKKAYSTIQIQKKVGKKRTIIDLRVKVDTGAQSNLLPISLYSRMFPEHMAQADKIKDGILTPSKVILTAYGEHVVPQLGKATIAGKHNEKEVICTFYVVKAEGPAILGLSSCRKLKIVTLNLAVVTSSPRIDKDMPIKDRPPIRSKAELINMYPECFDDTVGCFDYQYHITVDPNVQPVVHPPRRVPLELRERLKTQLEEMEAKGIITKVTQPTDWVNSIVVKEKPNGKLRICLDPKDLNKALKRDHYPTPTLEEITPSLAGSKVFSKLDASNGYWNIKITEESSMLTTFNTPFGRFRFNRLPFGLRVSQDVFQRQIDETYQGCKGAVGIADDIQIYGKDETTHDYNLHEAMEKTRRAGIKLNVDKCVIKEDECKFFGLIYSANGVKPDPAKVEAINHIEAPKDKKELRSFLGLIQYMGIFIPKLADHTANLRELMKEDAEYAWCASHTMEMNAIKQLISKETTLQYYNRHKPVLREVDASMKGVGAALMQEGRPVAFASKALTSAETRYANIERELLAVVYGCEKFHTYLYGRSFIIESDHRPLEQIDRKNLTKAPARLQRLLLRLQSYDYSITYKPGKDLLLADALSRLSPHDKHEMDGLSVKIHHIVSVTNNKLDEIRDKTSRDEELQLLAQTVTQGWPEKRHQVQPLIREYWAIRDDVSMENGVLMAGSRIIIPRTMQQEILTKIHQGHLGMEKCKLRAKSAVYWIGMYKDIEKTVTACHTCQKYRNSQQKEEMIPSHIPSRPWQTIGVDLFTENQEWYLILVCYYSKFPFVRKVKDLKATTITSVARGLFAEQGIPEQIICDNGTQFTSQEFKKLATEYGFTITTSSPYYPKGHGFVERQVQTAKKTLIKCREMKEDPHLALLSLRATPLKADMKSPAEMLNGRKYKTTLPTRIQGPIDQEETRAKLEAAQAEGQRHYNKHAQNLPELLDGQNVHVQDPISKLWIPAKIISKAETPRSYIIETETGSSVTRAKPAVSGVRTSDVVVLDLSKEDTWGAKELTESIKEARSSGKSRHKDKDRDKEREKPRDKDRERHRDKDRDKDSHRDKEHERKRDKDRDRQKEKDKDRERRKDREGESSKEKDRERRKDREKDSSKDKDRREKDRDGRKEREKESSKEKDRGEKDRSKHREKEKDRDREKKERSHRDNKESAERTDSGKKERHRDRDEKKREREKESGSRDGDKSSTKDGDRDKRREEKRHRDKDRERRKEKESNDSDRERRKHRDKDGSADRRKREKSGERKHRKEHKEEKGRSKSEHKNGQDERHEKKREDEDDVGEEILKVSDQKEQQMEESNQDDGYEDDFEVSVQK
eukprot:XP_011675590.1 PREDICTED: transposon Tf2-1 polyprotein [Strongylocentrotus purpuratus]